MVRRTDEDRRPFGGARFWSRMLDPGIVYVDSAPTLGGANKYQSVAAAWENIRAELLDELDCLRNWYKISVLDSKVHGAGLEYRFATEAAQRRHERFQGLVSYRFEVESPWFEHNQLYAFQHFGLALTIAEPRTLVQYDTGAGKTVVGTMTAQKLVRDDVVDRVLVVCERNKKADWAEFIGDNTDLSVELIGDKANRRKRHELYAATDAQVIVLNYEKFRYPSKKNKYARNEPKNYSWDRTDLWQLLQLVDGRRVLYILDEASKIGYASSLISKGLRASLISGDGPATPKSTRVVALTATPYITSPANIHHIFSSILPGLPYVSTTIEEFHGEYVHRMGSYGPAEWRDGKMYARHGQVYQRPNTLIKLGKRIEPYTAVAMKSDPEIARHFPEVIPRKISVELTDVDADLYAWIEDQSYDVWDQQSMAANLVNFQLLRIVCNTQAGLLNSQAALAEQIRNEVGVDANVTHSAKFQAVEELCKSVLASDDKIVLFSWFSNATIAAYLPPLRKTLGRDVPVLQYIGDMKEVELQDTKRRFNEIRGGAVLVASDAGQRGLDLYAPYLAHIESPYTYMAYKQRTDRVNRADSKAHGIEHTWIYRFVSRGTIEERVEERMYERKSHAEIISGVPQDNEQAQGPMDARVIRELMFGRRGEVAA